jgi:hypothetical protein
MERSGLNIFVKENSWVARMAASKMGATGGLAIVFFRTIYLHKITKSELLQNIPLLRHEVKHVLQYQQHTYVLFLIKYLWHSFRKGYYLNPFEIEAREAETDERILLKVNIMT